jgi:LuxR family maltose regulon positive regulatory protein
MGLSLGARARRIGHRVPSAVEAEHDRLVRRYLDNEVIPSLSTDQLALLEATAPLRRLDPQLCDLILDRTDSRALLTDLVERSCLVEPLSVDPPAFALHPMFAQHLRARGRSAGNDATSTTRNRAIEWYEDVELIDAAIELALEEPEPERAVALIKRVCGDRIRYGHSDLVAGWLQELPSDVLWNDVELSIVMGRAAGLIGDPMTGRAVLRTIRELVGADEASDGLGLALAQLEFSVRFWEGRLERIGRPIEERRAQFESCQSDPVLEMAGIDSESLHVSLVTGYVLDGELDRAIAECEHLLRPERMLDPTRLTIMGLGMLALALAWRGDEAAAREAVRRGKRVHGRYRGGGGDAGFLSAAALWVCDEGPHLDDDFRTVQRVVAGAVHLSGTAFAALAIAKLRLRLGAPVEAANALDTADGALAAMPEPGYLAVLRDSLRAELAEAAVDTIEPLNERELDVLAAVARCESRSDAASELYLSVNTVKTHLRSAYRKLRVTDRDQAIRRATALGMLDHQRVNASRRETTAQASAT